MNPDYFAFDLFLEYCHRESFKTYVRNLVQNENFWNNSQWRNLIRDECREICKRNNKEAKEEFKNELPGLVSLEMGRQLPGYLNNNAAMNDILNEHKAKLIVSISSYVDSTLKSLTSDDGYHQVHKLFFDAFKEKGDNEISAFKDKGDKEIAELRENYKAIEIELREKYDKVDQLNLKMQKIENSFFWVGTIGIGLGAIGIGLGILNKGFNP